MNARSHRAAFAREQAGREAIVLGDMHMACLEMLVRTELKHASAARAAVQQAADSLDRAVRARRRLCA